MLFGRTLLLRRRGMQMFSLPRITPAPNSSDPSWRRWPAHRGVVHGAIRGPTLAAERVSSRRSWEAAQRPRIENFWAAASDVARAELLGCLLAQELAYHSRNEGNGTKKEKTPDP